MQNIYDVLIIGAGPAGSTVAYEVASKGKKVLVLEKEKFPRYKACGGGITYKTAQLIPFDISSVIEKDIYQMSFSSKYKEQFQKRSEKCFMYCVMRENFDQYLINKAIDKGAEFIDACKVTEISGNNSINTIRTADSEYLAKVLVGADGPNSLVARYCGIDKEIVKGVTIEAEVKLNDYSSDFFDYVQIDWGTIPGGYAWIFPKNDHVSIGVGGPLTVSKYLKTYYRNILDKLAVPVAEEISFKAHSLPYRLKKGSFSKGNIILVGDAAGLTDALTGEGIYYAIKSGQIAGETISEFLDQKHSDLSVYDKRINKEVMNELLSVFPVLNIFHAFPSRVHNFLRDSDRAWNAFVRILRGEKLYSSFPKALGLYSFMWKTINWTAHQFYKRNLRRFRRTYLI